VGALVTLDLADDSPVLSLPWIITFGPLDDSDEWEPVVCGPYERAHALALAETVVADEELMAVVEPVLPHASVDEIRAEIENAKNAAESDEDVDFLDDDEEDEDMEVAVDDEFDADHDHSHDGHDHSHDGHDHSHFDDDDEYEDLPEVEPTAPPSPEEVKAGFARIAARLSAS
jgi:ABC-type Zn2+ transport system substrate-binding protein/surface adhesin